MFTTADRSKFENIRDILYSSAPKLQCYLGTMESATSTTASTVTVANNVRKVMSVWLATDTTFNNINYYSDPKLESFAGKVITLDTNLPAATIGVKVAYYSDCATCGWDAFSKMGRDPQCATCGGVGMTLALGTATEIPVKRLKTGRINESMDVLGEMTSGLVGFKAKAENANAIKAAIKLMFNDLEIEAPDSGKGLTLDYRYNAAGVLTEVEFLARYKRYQEIV